MRHPPVVIMQRVTPPVVIMQCITLPLVIMQCITLPVVIMQRVTFLTSTSTVSAGAPVRRLLRVHPRPGPRQGAPTPSSWTGTTPTRRGRPFRRVVSRSTADAPSVVGRGASRLPVRVVAEMGTEGAFWPLRAGGQRRIRKSSGAAVAGPDR